MQEFELVDIFSSYDAVNAVTIITDQETVRFGNNLPTLVSTGLQLGVAF